MQVTEVKCVENGWASVADDWVETDYQGELVYVEYGSDELFIFVDPDTGRFYATDQSNSKAQVKVAESAILAEGLGEKLDRFPVTLIEHIQGEILTLEGEIKAIAEARIVEQAVAALPGSF